MFDRKIREAFREDIPVVTFDGDIKTKENRLAYIGTDNYQAGIKLGKKEQKSLKKKYNRRENCSCCCKLNTNYNG